jgi:hypothetical protein
MQMTFFGQARNDDALCASVAFGCMDSVTSALRAYAQNDDP